MRFVVTFIAFLVCGTGFSQEKKSGTCVLRMTVKSITKTGVLYAGVLDSETSFKRRKPVLQYSKMVPIKKPGTQVLEFQMPPGVYAVALFLDTNGNGKLDFRFGKPTELVGMTNNPRKRGPPSWRDGAMRLTKSVSMEVRMYQK